MLMLTRQGIVAYQHMKQHISTNMELVPFHLARNFELFQTILPKINWFPDTEERTSMSC